MLGGGQGAAGHSALAVQEQREMGTLALFTSCSLRAASHGLVPPVSWEGLQCVLPAVGWCHLCPGRVLSVCCQLWDGATRVLGGSSLLR